MRTRLSIFMVAALALDVAQSSAAKPDAAETPRPVLHGTANAAREKSAAGAAVGEIPLPATGVNAARRERIAEADRKYDVNKDGVLDDAELAAAEAAGREIRKRGDQIRRERMQRELERYDRNNDGWLNNEEEAARKADLLDAARRHSPRRLAELEKRMKKAEAALAAEEADRELRKPVDPKRYDRNGNHQLETDERADYLKAVAERRERLRSTILSAAAPPASAKP